MAEGSDQAQKLQVLKPLIDFKGAVLDLDGTLLDAEPLYFEAYQHAANSYVHCWKAMLEGPPATTPRSTRAHLCRYGKEYTVRVLALLSLWLQSRGRGAACC